MDAVLVDTNVLSYLMKPHDTRGPLYAPHIAGKTVAISFVTVGEMYAWSVKPGYEWSDKRKADLDVRFKSLLIVPSDDAVCRAYASIAYLPEIVPANDRWIAACALRHGIPLVSHNRQDFESIPGLTLISEAPATISPSTVSPPLLSKLDEQG